PGRDLLCRGGGAEPCGAPEESEREEEMSIKVPAGACDTHMHFYDRNVPPAPGTPMPGHFDVPMYRALQKRLGIERVVVVQPNAYRDDNRVTMDAVKALGSVARAVAVVGETTPDAELERLTKD